MKAATDSVLAGENSMEEAAANFSLPVSVLRAKMSAMRDVGTHRKKKSVPESFSMKSSISESFLNSAAESVIYGTLRNGGVSKQISLSITTRLE